MTRCPGKRCFTRYNTKFRILHFETSILDFKIRVIRIYWIVR